MGILSGAEVCFWLLGETCQAPWSEKVRMIGVRVGLWGVWGKRSRRERSENARDAGPPEGLGLRAGGSDI